MLSASAEVWVYRMKGGVSPAGNKQLAAKLSCMIPELLESNGVVVDSYCVRVLQHTI